MGTRGVIMQTVPEEVAQAAEFLGEQYQLPVEVIIKAGISMMVAMTQNHDPHFAKFMSAVQYDFQRDVDRVLV